MMITTTESTPRRCASLVLLFLASACLVGCTYVRPRITFEEAQYPLSMTRVLIGASGNRIGDAELQNVGKLSVEDSAWSIAWGLIPVNGISVCEEINQQVAAAGGEAVIGVTVQLEGDPSLWNDISNLTFLVLPFPSSLLVRVEGDIVKRVAVNDDREHEGKSP